MPHLLDEVAQQFSMEGRKGKERFQGLKLWQVSAGMHNFVRQSVSVPNSDANKSTCPSTVGTVGS